MEPSWKYFLKYFRIEPTSLESILYFLLALIVIFILGAIIHIVLLIKRSRRRLEREWQWFYKIAEAKELSVDEMKALKHLVLKYYPKDPQYPVCSIHVLDTVIRKFLTDYEPWSSKYDKTETGELFEAIRDKYFLKDFHTTDNLKSTRELPPGQRIRIAVKTAQINRFLNSVVVNNSKDGLTLQCKQFKDLHNILRIGAELTGYFWRSGDAGYQFALKISRILDKEIVECAHTEDFTRKQRRHYYRVDVRLGGHFYRLSPEESRDFYQTGAFIKEMTHETFPGVIVSLSGGGISFFTEFGFSSNDLVYMEIHFKEGTVYKDMIGRVVRIKDLERRNKIYVEFIQVSEQMQEEIIRIVSFIQLEKRKKKREQKEKI